MSSEIKVVLFFITISALLGFTLVSFTPQAFAATVTISDVPSCEAAGGTFTPARNQCSFFGDLTIPEGDTWNISNLRFGVRTLILEGEVNAQNEMDVDFLTNRGTINVAQELFSIGTNNFWLNDCGATINLLPNTSFSFDASGTNHGTINGDATNDINPGSLSSNTLFNSGTISPSIVLINIVIANVESPCDPPPPEPQPRHSHDIDFGDTIDGQGITLTDPATGTITCPDGHVMTGLTTTFLGGSISFTPKCNPLTVLDFVGVLFAVGGEFLQIDTIAILLAYAVVNAEWFVPATIGIIGVGIYLTRRRFVH